MWTCDIIKAMQKLEKKIGHPFCIQSIRYLYNAPSILAIVTTGDEIYYYDTIREMLIEEE